jgi:hypothetical protein
MLALVPRLPIQGPLWLFGSGAQVGAFVFRALALRNGLISVVQPLLATELVFMLVLRRFWDSPVNSPGHLGRGRIDLREPDRVPHRRGAQGRATPASHHWFTAGAGVLRRCGGPGAPGIRGHACCFACCGLRGDVGLGSDVHQGHDGHATEFGVAGMFTDWPVYALVLGSVVALVLQQAALHAGPLRACQPLLVIVDPIVGIALSMLLFDEHFTTNTAVLATAAAALP